MKASILKEIQNASHDELREMNRAIIFALRGRRREEAQKFRFGQKVHFFASRTGEKINGTVERVNQTSVSVAVAGGLGWRVAPGLLKLGW
jgi:hypothetical protein